MTYYTRYYIPITLFNLTNVYIMYNNIYSGLHRQSYNEKNDSISYRYRLKNLNTEEALIVTE